MSAEWNFPEELRVGLVWPDCTRPERHTIAIVDWLGSCRPTRSVSSARIGDLTPSKTERVLCLHAGFDNLEHPTLGIPCKFVAIERLSFDTVGTLNQPLSRAKGGSSR